LALEVHFIETFSSPLEKKAPQKALAVDAFDVHELEGCSAINTESRCRMSRMWRRAASSKAHFDSRAQGAVPALVPEKPLIRFEMPLVVTCIDGRV
jgi:hypothetical protein